MSEIAVGKGSMLDPLTLADLPFTVPVAGRYWIEHSGCVTQLPEAPAGSVLALDGAPPLAVSAEQEKT